jgi:hypothetical protein
MAAVVLAIGLILVVVLARAQSAYVKANARVVVGGIACIVAGLAMYTNHNLHALNRPAHLAQKHLARVSALTHRLDDYYFTTLLGPEVAATPTGGFQVRALLAKYRQLLAEREGALWAYRQQPVHDSDVLQAYGALQRAQTALADRVSRVVNWYSTNAAAITIVAGSPRIIDVRLEVELQALVNEVAEAERVVHAEKCDSDPSSSPRAAKEPFGKCVRRMGPAAQSTSRS